MLIYQLKLLNLILVHNQGLSNRKTYDNMVLYFSKNGKHSNFEWTTSATDIVLLIFFAYFTFIFVMFNIPKFLRFGTCNFYHMQRIVCQR